MDEPEKAKNILTETQNNILNLMDVVLGLRSNLKFFQQVRKGNPAMEAAFRANVDCHNFAMRVIFSLKKSMTEAEYDFLLLNDPIFSKFHEVYLKGDSFELTVEPISQIFLPGDPG